MQRDYYGILGVDRCATQDQIKKAYRTLALQYHPDRNRGDAGSEELFKLLSESYEVLRDAGRRRAYDRTLEPDGSCAAGADVTCPAGAYVHADPLVRDFLQGFYRQQGSEKKAPRRGERLRCNLKVAFEEAVLGADREIAVPGDAACPQCRGTGIGAGAKTVRCPECRGRGSRKRGLRTMAVCQTCSGKGVVHTGLCRRCAGSGKTGGRRTVQVRIPPGITTGTRLRVTGAGRAGSQAADYLVVVQVAKHPLLERQGNDLFCRVPVPQPQARRGCSLEVPTLEGVASISIPPGTPDGTRLCLQGRGCRAAESAQRGDLIVEIALELPGNGPRSAPQASKRCRAADPAPIFPAAEAYKKKMAAQTAGGTKKRAS
jgi:molecular chaperone DnaJ